MTNNRSARCRIHLHCNRGCALRYVEKSTRTMWKVPFAGALTAGVLEDRRIACGVASLNQDAACMAEHDKVQQRRSSLERDLLKAQLASAMRKMFAANSDRSLNSDSKVSAKPASGQLGRRGSAIPECRSGDLRQASAQGKTNDQVQRRVAGGQVAGSGGPYASAADQIRVLRYAGTVHFRPMARCESRRTLAPAPLRSFA